MTQQQENNTPSEWHETTVGEFAPFTYGKSLKAKDRNPDGNVPVFGSNGIVGYHDAALTAGPTVIIGRKGTAGAVHYSPEPCWPIDTTFFITGDDPHLIRFKHYALGAIGLPDMNTDSAVPGLNRNAAHARELRIPPLPEQRRIAHILGTLDDKIELNRRMNETLDEMARAIFKDWFVDFGPVRAKMEGRDPYLPDDIWSLFPDNLADSELGQIPNGWKVSCFGELADIVGGTTPSTKEPLYWEDGIHHFTTPKDLSSLVAPVLLDTAKLVSDAGLAKISSGLLPIGTVLLSSRAPIGYLAVTQIPVAVNQGLIAVKPNPDISNLFLLYSIESQQHEIVNRANGTTFLEINKTNFRPIAVVLPCPAVMSAFHGVADALFSRIVANERESRTLAAMRDTLLPKLVSGEVRVNT